MSTQGGNTQGGWGNTQGGNTQGGGGGNTQGGNTQGGGWGKEETLKEDGVILREETLKVEVVVIPRVLLGLISTRHICREGRTALTVIKPRVGLGGPGVIEFG
ncbi:hypothetical protein JCGZ_16820 [Jatropha curcas]|uniref:Uncharacterized protein n=1 Tax=Jatropha curcas TaxID=180498 RepID=A0A067L8F1_JATCU|nr:hypothetical protein JCGZ_16820 [Jatropha curcas]